MIRQCLVGWAVVLWGLVPAAPSALAADDLPLWDSAVNTLLAAGMYGVDLDDQAGARLRMFPSRDRYQGAAADRALLDGQTITFSYQGSSGFLGFSAGYIYTSGRQDGRFGAVYLGIDDPLGLKTGDHGDAWYLALDLATSYQPHDDISLALGGRTSVMTDPLDPGGERMISLLLNMPVSYRKYITITPEIQWSRPVADLLGRENSGADQDHGSSGGDVFYGGVSVTFSY